MSTPSDLPALDLDAVDIGPVCAEAAALAALLKEDAGLSDPGGRVQPHRVGEIQQEIHAALGRLEAKLIAVGVPAGDPFARRVVPRGPRRRAFDTLLDIILNFGGRSRKFGLRGSDGELRVDPISRELGPGPGWPDELARLEAVLELLRPGPDGGGPGGKAGDFSFASAAQQTSRPQGVNSLPAPESVEKPDRGTAEARALALIAADGEREWTIKQLAAELGLHPKSLTRKRMPILKAVLELRRSRKLDARTAGRR
jgi:hypothetical protein